MYVCGMEAGRQAGRQRCMQCNVMRIDYGGEKNRALDEMVTLGGRGVYAGDYGWRDAGDISLKWKDEEGEGDEEESSLSLIPLTREKKPSYNHKETFL